MNDISNSISKITADIDPYITCPSYETESFILRLIDQKDTEQLLRCYSDKSAVQLMNADNCNNDFYYPTPEQMQEAVDFWIFSYQSRYFIRLTIVDKASMEAVGTIEIFGGGIGVYRVDLIPRYEKADYLKELYRLAEKEFFHMLQNERIVTKAVDDAKERRHALTECGWNYIDQFRTYPGYYEKLSESM